MDIFDKVSQELEIYDWRNVCSFISLTRSCNGASPVSGSGTIELITIYGSLRPRNLESTYCKIRARAIVKTQFRYKSIRFNENFVYTTYRNNCFFQLEITPE